jgi:hypothetical protein
MSVFFILIIVSINLLFETGLGSNLTAASNAARTQGRQKYQQKRKKSLFENVLYLRQFTLSNITWYTYLLGLLYESEITVLLVFLN